MSTVNYNFDDPRASYSIVPKDIPQLALGASSDIIGKAKANLAEAVNAMANIPFSADMLSGLLSEFQKHGKDLTATAFSKINPNAINTVYKEIENKLGSIPECDKQQLAAGLVTMLKNAEVMVKHATESSLPNILSKQDKVSAVLEERRLEFSEAFKDLISTPKLADTITDNVSSGLAGLSSGINSLGSSVQDSLSVLNPNSISASISKGLNEYTTNLANISVRINR